MSTIEKLNKKTLSNLITKIDDDNNMFFCFKSGYYSCMKICFNNESNNTYWFNISLHGPNDNNIILQDYDITKILYNTGNVIILINKFTQMQLWSFSNIIIPKDIFNNTREIYTSINVLVSAVRTRKTNLYIVEKIMEYFKLPLSSNISKFSAKINKMVFKREIFCLI